MCRLVMLLTIFFPVQFIFGSGCSFNQVSNIRLSYKPDDKQEIEVELGVLPNRIY